MSQTQSAETEHDHKDALNSGWDLIERKSYEDAIVIFKAILDIEPVHSAYHGLGHAYFQTGDVLRAVAALTHAVRLDKTDPVVFALMGDVYSLQAQGQPAIECYAQAVAYDPDNHEYRQKLIGAVSGNAIKKRINPNLKGIVLMCMEDTSLELKHLGPFWLSVISNDPELSPYYNLSKHKKYSAFKKSLDAMPASGLINAFFLTGLGQFIVPDAVFENWFVYLRRYILDAHMEGRSLFTDAEDIELIACAMMRYAHLTDYVFSTSEEEMQAIKTLEGKLSSSKNAQLSDVALYGCYAYVSALPKAADIAKDLPGGDHVSQIPKSQIESALEQRSLVKKIEQIVPLEEGVSKDVQEQYEAFPYPRWTVAAKNLFNEKIEMSLKAKNVKILNAGCGTGQEAIQLSYVFPDAEIVAVDLSLTSLAYAQYKADQLGVKNVRFAQGDILNLGQLDDKFDYITSAGVLHHMADPEAGWKTLTSLLKPKGLMRIGLYSRQARWAINQARAQIEKKNIGSDAASIRAFRDDLQDHVKLKAAKNIQRLYDYYSLPECRDLLFHVQEHQYDLTDIKDMLERLNLEFLQFYLSGQTVDKYKRQNKDDPDAIMLDKWAAWEQKNPDAFIGMYTFWCQKKGD